MLETIIDVSYFFLRNNQSIYNKVLREDPKENCIKFHFFLLIKKLVKKY